jgi:hypothetical protein
MRRPKKLNTLRRKRVGELRARSAASLLPSRGCSSTWSLRGEGEDRIRELDSELDADEERHEDPDSVGQHVEEEEVLSLLRSGHRGRGDSCPVLVCGHCKVQQRLVQRGEGDSEADDGGECALVAREHEEEDLDRDLDDIKLCLRNAPRVGGARAVQEVDLAVGRVVRLPDQLRCRRRGGDRRR